MWVGSTPGGQEYGYCGTTGLTCTLSGLPSNGSAVYATLYGYANSNWTIEDSAQYTAATISKAQITSPTNWLDAGWHRHHVYLDGRERSDGLSDVGWNHA